MPNPWPGLVAMQPNYVPPLGNIDIQTGTPSGTLEGVSPFQ